MIATKPSYSGPCDHYRPLIERYEWDAETMLAIMQAESGCDPQAIGDDYQISGLYAPSCGLMQIRTLRGRPTCEELKDPATNTATAYRVYQSQGLKAWSVHNSGKYKQFMKE